MKSESVLSTKLALYSEFSIKSADFQTLLYNAENELKLSASWINRNEPFEFKDLTDHFEIDLPDCFNFQLLLEKVSLSYATKNSDLKFEIVEKKYGNLVLDTHLEETGRNYNLVLNFKEAKILLSVIPIIGYFVSGDDGFYINNFFTIYIPNKQFEIGIKTNIKILGIEHQLTLSYLKELKGSNLKSELLSEKLALDSIKWFEINKNFGVLYFSRIGFSFKESRVVLFLDAGFTISILRLDFYELFVSIALNDIKDIGFGLSGLSVTLNKPPFYLSGGLYKSPTEKCLYNGSLILKLSKFCLVALASYGELDGGEPSFFLFAMIGAPIGGHPCFFVTGLALGFGVNRSIKLPDIKEVRKFPFVAAVLGTNKNLNSNTKPVVALNELSDSVYPANGNYFFTAGIKFTTFELLETFALLNIEVGKNFVVSILGVSSASIPPKLTDVTPIAFAELAIKAVIDPDQGHISVMAGLTDESYIFDKNCKITGGFAVCLWFTGEYAGDFLITLGGCHHPDFKNIHYPDLDRVGINWTINSNISIKGNAYFAITPSSLMAGGELQLMYKWENLKAWFRAIADFIIQWKPYHYDINVSVSLGASYTVKILGIHKTFKLEIGAGLHLYGPDFSGSVHVKWYIISFTIKFGDEKSKSPDPLSWQEFSHSFLPNHHKSKLQSVADGEKRICDITFSDGILQEIKEDERVVGYVVNPYNVKITTTQSMPCTSIWLNNQEIETYKGSIGIVAMQLSNVTIKQKITIEYKTQKGFIPVDFDYIIQRQNVPKALWGNSKPSINDTTINNVPTGVELIPINMENTYHLLPPGGAYDTRVLNQGEVLSKNLVWNIPSIPEGIDYKGVEPLTEMQRTIAQNKKRDSILSELSRHFETRSITEFHSIVDSPKDTLLSTPVLKTTGSLKVRQGV